MKYRTPIIFALLCFASSGVGAVTTKAPPRGYKWGRCLLQVDGKPYLSGRCLYTVLDKSGSFEIISDKQLRGGDEGYFAYVNIDRTTAEASWNEEPDSSHAQAPLGTVRRRNACWVNSRARICLWRR